ncbi:hypothetical protein A2778_05480 [Candidatus Daviesbacteria bacterium RIFCSPHIGHO2_01_FULL_40_24]|uniref:DUF218 domain-containing protein n=1 Tax=Candidatus Daviesbacteria bacterium GW2011_GWC2_40_12 TaxID=1618431 RepID=A0A0G0QRN7_9BACT|nr:MAG: hypothetical protein UT45_C0001G0111 [Candidatus Daviesbacteria bacterium GW2011_GWA2_39_33]KKR42813.1 MAG: hypothetical protein UT77_C0001G0264 [Candidatus Daviesbacteria bacterium GW2011_GWC2_40_12]OGE21608.1 MAG: hypothetical protein A2778_05480 [Candidatus Daviesbacteria bacterium RIFCSPHIGHO2_01_FULL_40_24]OGE30005.1 MAG: hypothetical protein A3C29_01185 [Candidatus Daviesbacteria bacterium RIFCSPHIGHO2_02_FULL_40_16]OGE43560.1 MAG: hypothetical protein A3A53_02930 [Candidatus Davi
MKKKLLFICLGLISIAVILYWLKVPHLLIGRYLAPSDNLSRADAIVVVSGDSDRMRQAIDLYKQGYAPKLILSGAARDGITSNALAMHIEASQSGIPNEAVILEEKANNTYENALYTKEIVLSQGMQNIILVTSPYHQRRVYETFKNVFKGSKVKLQNSPSIYSSWKPDNWWNRERELHLTQEETIKVLWSSITGSY